MCFTPLYHSELRVKQVWCSQQMENSYPQFAEASSDIRLYLKHHGANLHTTAHSDTKSGINNSSQQMENSYLQTTEVGSDIRLYLNIIELKDWTRIRSTQHKLTVLPHESSQQIKISYPQSSSDIRLYLKHHGAFVRPQSVHQNILHTRTTTDKNAHLTLSLRVARGSVSHTRDLKIALGTSNYMRR